MQTHSDLGASGAERWMNCSGSVALIRQMGDGPDSDEPEYRSQGTAAHAFLAECLENNLDSYMVVGHKHENGVVCTPEMANAIQVFLDIAVPLMQPRPGRSVGLPYIEHPMAHPEFHQKFFGTVDFAIVGTEGRSVLDVLDFKYGEGVLVEANHNPQAMYYAYGILLMHPEIDHVRIRIVQPRITWNTDPVFEISSQELRAWAESTLRPAMEKADRNEGGLLPGDWCRFCPAKLVCPVLTHLFGAAATGDVDELRKFGHDELDRNYPLIGAVKHYINALEAEQFRRLQTGEVFTNSKLVHKRANRVFKEGAAVVFKSKFGDEAFEPASLKSPAEMEKLNAAAKTLVHEYAYTPESGLTVAPRDDKRVEVKVQPLSEMFPTTTEIVQ